MRRTQPTRLPVSVAFVISSELRSALAINQHKDRWHEAGKELEAAKSLRIDRFHSIALNKKAARRSVPPKSVRLTNMLE
jgi:hypothetical protein